MLSKRSILIVLLIFCVLFQYFEWGTNTKAFAIQMMLDVFSDKKSLFHPMIILPMLALAGLVYSLGNPNRGNRILWISIVIACILMLLTLFTALISMKLIMAISPVLFITFSVILFLQENRSKKNIN